MHSSETPPRPAVVLDEPSSTTEASAPAKLRLFLTDNPLEGVEAVNVTISRVDVVHSLGLITVSDEPQTFNLLALRNGVRAALGLTAIPPGRVRSLSFV